MLLQTQVQPKWPVAFVSLVLLWANPLAVQSTTLANSRNTNLIINEEKYPQNPDATVLSILRSSLAASANDSLLILSGSRQLLFQQQSEKMPSVAHFAGGLERRRRRKASHMLSGTFWWAFWWVCSLALKRACGYSESFSLIAKRQIH